jgi:hypothetical protein
LIGVFNYFRLFQTLFDFSPKFQADYFVDFDHAVGYRLAESVAQNVHPHPTPIKKRNGTPSARILLVYFTKLKHPAALRSPLRRCQGEGTTREELWLQ